MRTTTNRSTSHARHSGNGRHPGIRRKLDDVVESVKELGAEAKYTAQQQIDAARESAGEYVADGRRQVADLEETFEDRVKASPMKSLLIAAGVGMVCGFFLCRR